VKESLCSSGKDFEEQQVGKGVYGYHQWLQGILGRKSLLLLQIMGEMGSSGVDC